jgi:hypothetical protein
MFSYAQSMKTHGIGCLGIGYGSLAHSLFTNAAFFAEVIHIHGQHMGFKIIITFSSI